MDDNGGHAAQNLPALIGVDADTAHAAQAPAPIPPQAEREVVSADVVGIWRS